MSIRNRGTGLQFNDDLAEAEKIGLIETPERLALVFQEYTKFRVFRPKGEFPCRGGSRKPKVDVGASDGGRACSSPQTLVPTSIARQGDSASPVILRFQCQY